MHWLLSNSEHVKNLAEAVALICAAVFFLWKTVSGYLFVNLSVGIKLARTKGSNESKNYLVTTVKIVKGDRASLLLTRVALIIRNAEETLEDINLDVSPGGDRGVMRLTPGESYQFAHYCEVPANATCMVHVFVEGATTEFAPTGYWHVSAASVPQADKPTKVQNNDLNV